MRRWRSVSACACAALVSLLAPLAARAADIFVPAGGDLQAALNAARAGDTVLLAPGATFTGTFRLPVHGGTTYVTVRSAAPDASLPPEGTRISPAYASVLPKIQSSSSVAALRTAPGAGYWRLQFLEIGPNAHTAGTALELGDGSNAQNTLALVPH